ncbi:MAG: filamentous hemagglutinin N-terminal domain-containing protein [Leptolyngbyaceae cyanobacterium]
MVLHPSHLLGLGLFSVLLWSGTARGQTVTPDGTINTVVSSPNSNRVLITGGTLQGENLFHSFTTFSPQSWAAHFDLTDESYNGSADAVGLIISRVTGNNASRIDGLLQVSGGSSPNLFLINPNGIIFGPNAHLNVPGSFIASTAEGLEFADGTTFATDDTTPNPLLTITAPVGLNLPANPAPIQVEGNGHHLGLLAENPVFGPTIPGMEMAGLMTAVSGQTLGFLGGELRMTGGTVIALDGRVELGAVGGNSPAQVGLSLTSTGWQFDYSGVESFGDIVLSQQAAAYASGITTPGSMQLVGQQITLTDGSMALLQSLGPVLGGGLRAIASEGINIIGTVPTTLLRSQIRTEALGTGRGANLSIITPRLQIQDGGRVETTTFAHSDSGDLTIQAADAVEVTGFAPGLPEMFSSLSSTTLGSGRTGNLTIDTVRLSAQAGGFVSVATLFGTGNSGNLVVHATERVEVMGGTSLFPSAVNANSISSGDTNSVTINTQQLVVQDGGLVGSQAFASGSGGNVIIRASEFIEVTGSSPTTGVSQIGASVIIAPGVNTVFGLSSDPTGQAGSVEIATPRLRVSDRGAVSVQNEGTGASGDLQIAADLILLDADGRITASTVTGGGGNIGLRVANLLLLQDGSLISAEAGGRGNGGNLDIDAPKIAGLENSDMVATAVFGNGGNIQITTQAIFGLEFQAELTPASDITASSQFGVSGTVAIAELEVDPRSEAVELATEFVDPSRVIVQGCGAQMQGNEFIVTGRGGVPPAPTTPLTPDRTWQDVRDPSAYLDNVPITATTIAPGAESWVEMNRWLLAPDGAIELIATPPTTIVAPTVTCPVSPLRTKY